MTLPTRAQITRSFNQPKYRVEMEWNGVFYQVPDDHVVELSGSMISNGNIQNGLSFGSYVEPSASVTVFRRFVIHPSVGNGYDHALWINKRVRIYQAFETSAYKPIFVGVISSYSINGEELTYDISGMMEYLRNIKLSTPVYYGKPIATKTTAASAEDPTVGGYNAGLLNYIFWQAGGRPWEQNSNATYVSAAKFWYQCDQSTINPDWLWLANENLVDEIFLLARSAGGQIYEYADVLSGAAQAVVRFIDPLNFADTTGYGSYYNFTTDTYQSFSKRLSVENQAGKVTAKFATRRLQPSQEVYTDKTPYLIKNGETRTFICNVELPVFEYETISSSAVSATPLISSANADKTISLTVNATAIGGAQVTLSITNSTGAAAMITGITLRGRPIAVEEEGEVEVGSSTPVQAVEDNPYIQTRDHALRLAKMVYALFNTLAPSITLQGVIYDPDRFVGELVQIDNSDNVIYSSFAGTWIQDTSIYKIIRISHNGTGTSMDIDFVPITTLLNPTDFYIVDTTYNSATSKKLAF